jgi:hypothetical protein
MRARVREGAGFCGGAAMAVGVGRREVGGGADGSDRRSHLSAKGEKEGRKTDFCERAKGEGSRPERGRRRAAAGEEGGGGIWAEPEREEGEGRRIKFVSFLLNWLNDLCDFKIIS